MRRSRQPNAVHSSGKNSVLPARAAARPGSFSSSPSIGLVPPTDFHLSPDARCRRLIDSESLKTSLYIQYIGPLKRRSATTSASSSPARSTSGSLISSPIDLTLRPSTRALSSYDGRTVRSRSNLSFLTPSVSTVFPTTKYHSPSGVHRRRGCWAERRASGSWPR